jgi:hypothetical protein
LVYPNVVIEKVFNPFDDDEIKETKEERKARGLANFQKIKERYAKEGLLPGKEEKKAFRNKQSGDVISLQ